MYVRGQGVRYCPLKLVSEREIMFLLLGRKNALYCESGLLIPNSTAWVVLPLCVKIL